jgi:hypothetical protein
MDEYHCEDCAMGSLPSHDHSRCEPIPEEFIDYQNPWAIAAMAVASLGQLYVIFRTFRIHHLLQQHYAFFSLSSHTFLIKR